MKKILLLSIIVILPFLVKGQQTPLSTILTWYETGDTPTQSQYEISWKNSYNAVADGMWDLTGYPSIGFVPYTSMAIGKFSNIAGFPTDTTTRLNFNGTLKVSNLWVNGQKYSGGGSSGWTISGSNLYPTSTSTNIAIGTTSSAGYDLYVLGTTYSTTSIRSATLNLINSLGNTGTINVDAFGNLSFKDYVTTTEVSLAQLIGGGSWTKTNSMLSYLDTVSIGQAPGVQDSLFNVYGTMYVEGSTRFRMPVLADSGLVTDEYVETPSVNFAYGTTSGRIDLYDAGEMTFYDVNNPTGVTLSSLGSGYFKKVSNDISPTSATDNLLIGGAVANSLFDLSVNGGSLFGGVGVFSNGLSLGYGTKIQFTNGYISNSASGLTFNDAYAGQKTLTELAGVYGDSISVSLLNVDTVYWNGTTNKKLFSPQTNNLFLQIDTAQWRFESFNTGTEYQPVFHTNALQMSAMGDAIQSELGWEQQGKLYLSTTDTVFKYATGKAGQWNTLATTRYVSNALSGLGGINLQLDTLFFNSYIDYLTSGGSHSIILNTKSAGGNDMRLSAGANPNISGNNSSIIFATNYITLTHGANNFMFDGLTFRNATDTLATKAYARANGGGTGGGTPGGATTTLQYNNGGVFGGFWAYNGTNISPTTNTGLAWSANSFLKGYTADSVVMGKKLQITNNYTAETAIAYTQRLFQDYDGGYLDAFSKVYLNYTDANANSGNAYGVYSEMNTDENYSTTGNTSYSSAGNFILKNKGTTQIGGATPGTTYLNAVYGEVSGTIDSTATPGTYKVAAIYGKNSNVGTAKTWAGYFDGNVKTVGYIYGDRLYSNNIRMVDTYAPDIFNSTVTGSSLSFAWRSVAANGYFYTGTTDPTTTARLNYDGYLHATRFYDENGRMTNMDTATVNNLISNTLNTTNFAAYATYYAAPDTFVGVHNGAFVYTLSSGGGGGTGTLLPYGSPAINQIAFWHSGTTLTGDAGFIYNTVTPLSGAFYSGASNPSSATYYMNYDGHFRATTLSAYSATTALYGSTTGGSTARALSVTAAGGIPIYVTNTGSLSATSTNPVVYISRTLTGTSYGVNGDIISIIDNPSSSSGITGSVLKAQIGASTVRLDLNPRLSNGSVSAAYLFDTHVSLTSNTKVLQVKNNGTEKFYIRADTSTFINDLKYRGNLYSWKYRALTDTFAMVLYPGGMYDTASFVIASKGWDVPLEDFNSYYAKASELKALPLPYPDGTERRRPNAKYMSYQFEYELERLTRYLKDEYDKNKVLSDRIQDLERRIDYIEKK